MDCPSYQEIPPFNGGFSWCDVLANPKPLPARFLILGSASPNPLLQSSESLAGRIEIIPVGGFSVDEVGASSLKRHWQRGEFPLSFLARTSDDS
jgi:predicted AAA+ superfamily ATPase